MAISPRLNVIPVWDLVLLKGIAFALIIPTLLFLTPQQVFTQYAVWTQGHFILSYWYQYKTGKLNLRWYSVGAYCAVVALFFVFVFEDPSDFIFIVITFFAVHFLLDEFRLNTERLSLSQALIGLPFLLIFLLVVFKHQYVAMPVAWAQYTGGKTLPDLNAFTPGFLGTALPMDQMPAMHQLTGPMIAGWLPFIWASFVVAVGVWGWSSLRDKRVNIYGVTVLAMAFFGLLLMPSLPIIYARSFIGVVLMLHGLNWYISYFYKFRHNGPACRTFGWEVAGITVFLVGMFSLNHAMGWWRLDEVMFGFRGYNVWAMMHLLTTIRGDDYNKLWQGLTAWRRRPEVGAA